MYMNNKIKKYIKYALCLILFFISFYCVATVVIASTYSVLVADDFSLGASVGTYDSVFDAFSKSINYLIHFYSTWQGTYFTAFFQSLMSPVSFGGLLQLRIFMFFNSVTFFSALAFFVFSAFDKIKKEYMYIISIVICGLIVLLTCNEYYTEIFYWFSGATSYAVPFSLLLFSLSFFIRFNYYGKKVYFYLSIVFGFLSMGGTLAIAGVGCFIMLLLCGVFCFYCRENFVRNCIAFLSYFIGAIVNALAPGNFARHNTIDSSGLHPKTALVNSINIVDDRYQHFFVDTNFILIVFLLFICGIILGKRYQMKLKPLFLLSIMGLLTPIVSMFPVNLGYSSAYIPERCVFVLDMSILLSATSFSISTGFIIGEKCLKFSKNCLVYFLITASVITMMDGYSLKSARVFKISSNLLHGAYQAHFVTYTQFYNSLKSYENDSDVVIEVENMPYNIEGIYNFSLTNDTSDWVNYSVAKSMGLNSIKVLKE